MKKKLSLLLCLIFVTLGLAACGTDPQDVDYYGMTYADFQDYAEQYVEILSGLSAEERAYYKATSEDEGIKNLVSTWDEAVKDLGAYQGTGEFSLTQAQNTITVEQIALFEEREVCVTFVFSYNYETKHLEQTDASADLVYTMGEKMGKAGMNTLMGMGTVFGVLILISLIIYCFRFISAVQQKSSGSQAQPEKKEPVAAAVQPAAQPLTDDLELVAVISAAVAASTGASADSFVVRSIRRR